MGKVQVLRKTLFIKSLFCLSLSILFISKGFAQDVRDKFTNGTVFNLKQDNHGRIWMATDNGLYVSDANNYIQIVIGDKELTNSSIKELVFFNDELYILYENKGLVKLDINSLVSEKITENPVANVIVQDQKNLFILYKNGDLYNVTNKKDKKRAFKLITQIGNDRDNSPSMINFSNKSILVAVVNKGIFRINKQTGLFEKTYNIIPDGFNNKFVSFKERIFFLFQGRAYELNQGEQFVPSSYLMNYKSISNFIPVDDNKKIVITHKKNIYQISNLEEVKVTTSKEKSYEVYDALSINKNYVIYGTNQGIFKVINNNKKILNIYDSSIQKEEYINVRRKIIPYKENKIILLGFPTPHLYDLETKKFTPLTRSNNSTFDGVVIGTTIFATSEGGGVKKIDIDAKTIKNIQTDNIDTIKFYGAIENINHIVNNTILLGRRGVLVLYNYKNNSSSEIDLKNLNAKINAIKIDSLSKLIYVATNDGIYIVDFLNKKIKKKINIPGHAFFDILIQHNNNKSYLWSISDQGLIQIDLSNNRLLVNVNSSRFNNTKLTTILADRNNRIWISSYSGIYSFDKESNKLVLLTGMNGLMNQEFNYKSAALLNNGNIIFGGLNGYDIIYSNEYDFNYKDLEGKILGYSIYGPNGVKYFHYNQGDIVQYNTSNYYIEFYFSMKENEKFRFSKFEFQIDQSEFTKILDLSYFYMYDLKDGVHTINLRGLDDAGHIINFIPIKVNHVTDFFNSVNFKYFLFFIIISILLITIFLIYFNYKNLILLRSNIAMDLHDEIGSIINRSLFIVKSDEHLGNNNNLINYLSEAMYSIRTYIKAFNTEKISLHDFLNEVKDFNQIFAKGLDIKFTLSYNFDKEYLINSNLYKDLKLMMYEIHHNIVKHSQAKTVKTTVIAESNTIEIIVEDDGNLINIESIENMGNGIANIRKRVERSRGKVNFSISAGGHGLQIKGLFYI